ncbi:universal stress protein [soil metagenome]
MMPFETILFAADLSPQSTSAFRYALGLARDYKARLKVVYVATPPPLVTPRELQRMLEDANGYRADLENCLRQTYPADSLSNVDYCVLEGDPVMELLEAARYPHCGLIVVGTHGRTGLSRALLGSVAEAVIRRADCPVLVVKSLMEPLPAIEPALAELQPKAAGG